MAKKENKEIKKAMDIIDEMSMDEKEWELYMSRHRAILDYNSGMSEAKRQGIEDGLKEGRKQGIEQGIKEGIEQGIRKTAKNMLKKGVAVEIIEETTGLTKQEIKELTENK